MCDISQLSLLAGLRRSVGRTSRSAGSQISPGYEDVGIERQTKGRMQTGFQIALFLCLGLV